MVGQLTVSRGGDGRWASWNKDRSVWIESKCRSIGVETTLNGINHNRNAAVTKSKYYLMIMGVVPIECTYPAGQCEICHSTRQFCRILSFHSLKTIQYRRYGHYTRGFETMKRGIDTIKWGDIIQVTVRISMVSIYL